MVISCAVDGFSQIKPITGAPFPFSFRKDVLLSFVLKLVALNLKLFNTDHPGTDWRPVY